MVVHPRLLLLAILGACAEEGSSTDDVAAGCEYEGVLPADTDYASGSEASCATLAWAAEALLAESRAAWAPDAYLASATCDVDPATGLLWGDNCLAYFASPSVSGEHAACILPHSPRCDVLPDNTDGYVSGDHVAAWRVDSTIAVNLQLVNRTADAEVSVHPMSDTTGWNSTDGAAPAKGTPLLVFPGNVVVDGTTGEVLSSPP